MIKKSLLLFIISIFFSVTSNAFFWNNSNSLYQKGDFVYVYREKWRPAKILKVVFHNGKNYYHVTFVGLTKEYDVWAKESRMHNIK